MKLWGSSHEAMACTFSVGHNRPLLIRRHVYVSNYVRISMSQLLTFNQLWDLATRVARKCNGLCYHPCCDVWTTRSSKSKRASHSHALQWRKIILSLACCSGDKKEALLAKMSQEDWRVPAVLNEHCKTNLKTNIDKLSPFKLHRPHQTRQEFEASLVTNPHCNKASEDTFSPEPGNSD